MNQSNNIFISRLPNNVTEFSIIKILSQFGKITTFNFPVHTQGKDKGRTLGYCFVSYDNYNDAYEAIVKINKLRISNTTLLAKWAKPKMENDVELTYEYDENIITKELENEAGIIDKAKLSQILEKSKTIQIEKKVTNEKCKVTVNRKNLPNPAKSFKDKQTQIKKIEEALKKYSSF